MDGKVISADSAFGALLRGKTYNSAVIGGSNSYHVHIHRRRKHTSVLLVGVVAAYLGASGSGENLYFVLFGIKS